uniref:TF-B3 domain-containing protein n=1 Tax=Setaria italica TaxID=4555 RepID=K3XSX9_SETIT
MTILSHHDFMSAIFSQVTQSGNSLQFVPNLASALASSATVILKNAEGKTWLVELEEIDGRVFLTSGWSKFVEGNCLGQGEFLVFEYDGNIHFRVSVFGANAVEKAVWPSASGAPPTGNLGGGEQPCDISPSSKRRHSGDELTETVKSLMRRHAQVDILDHTQGDEHISAQDTICFLDPHEVGCSKDELETSLSQKEPMEDDKAKAIVEVMRTLHVDKLTVELFCATLCLYKWKVEAAAEDINICRGKPQILEQSLKQKLVLQFDFVKSQLRHFFPPDVDSERIKKNNLEGPNLSNQPLQCDLTVAPVKRRLVDEHKSCDLSHQHKRKTVKLQRGSPQPQTPRRSPRLAHLNNTCNNTNEVLKERAEGLKPPQAAKDQVKDRVHKAHSLHEKPDNSLKAVREETTGSLSQDLRKLDPPQCEVGLSKENEHDQGETRKFLDHSNDRKNSEEQMEINGVGTSELFMSTDCIESSPNNSGLTAYSRINELSFTWKHSQHANPIEKILLDIQRGNFVNTITHIQKVIQDDPSNVLSADVIGAVVQIGLLKCDLCLQDRNARKIVNALLEYAKKVREKHNFSIEMRKEEFSAKLQDLLKWQLKELETTYTSLESDYKKATTDSTISFSTLEEHRKKLHAIKDGMKDSQQALMIREDEIQKLAHKVAEHETICQKSLMEKVRVKTALNSYQKTLGDVKEQLASTEPGFVDVDALVKVEMDNMSTEIQLSKGILLNINFEKE